VIDLAAVIEQFLEPPEPGVLVELDRDDAAALAAEVRAARAVVAAARGCPELMGPGVFDGDLIEATKARLVLALVAYDQATSAPPTSPGGGEW
jgi:hypothetical protein